MRNQETGTIANIPNLSQRGYYLQRGKIIDGSYTNRTNKTNIVSQTLQRSNLSTQRHTNRLNQHSHTNLSQNDTILSNINQSQTIAVRIQRRVMEKMGQRFISQTGGWTDASQLADKTKALPNNKAMPFKKEQTNTFDHNSSFKAMTNKSVQNQGAARGLDTSHETIGRLLSHIDGCNKENYFAHQKSSSKLGLRGFDNGHNLSQAILNRTQALQKAAERRLKTERNQASNKQQLALTKRNPNVSHHISVEQRAAEGRLGTAKKDSNHSYGDRRGLISPNYRQANRNATKGGKRMQNSGLNRKQSLCFDIFSASKKLPPSVKNLVHRYCCLLKQMRELGYSQKKITNWTLTFCRSRPNLLKILVKGNGDLANLLTACKAISHALSSAECGGLIQLRSHIKDNKRTDTSHDLTLKNSNIKERNRPTVMTLRRAITYEKGFSDKKLLSLAPKIFDNQNDSQCQLQTDSKNIDTQIEPELSVSCPGNKGCFGSAAVPIQKSIHVTLDTSKGGQAGSTSQKQKKRPQLPSQRKQQLENDQEIILASITRMTATQEQFTIEDGDQQGHKGELKVKETRAHLNQSIYELANKAPEECIDGIEKPLPAQLYRLELALKELVSYLEEIYIQKRRGELQKSGEYIKAVVKGGCFNACMKASMQKIKQDQDKSDKLHGSKNDSTGTEGAHSSSSAVSNPVSTPPLYLPSETPPIPHPLFLKYSSSDRNPIFFQELERLESRYGTLKLVSPLNRLKFMDLNGVYRAIGEEVERGFGAI